MEEDVLIEKLAYGGEGIGRLKGKVCFVDGALPGEKVALEGLQDKKKFLRAKTKEVLLASPHRVKPPCSFYGACGGCQYQHLEYREELRWKEIQVREHLERNLGLAPEKVKPIVPSPKEYGYRSSVTLHARGGNPLRGFIGKDNVSLVPVSECLLAEPALQPVFKNSGNGQRDVTYRVSKGGEVISSQEDRLFEMEVAGQTLQTHAQGFFQNNLEITALIGRQLELWIQQVQPKTFLDLYAGVGTFSLLSAKSVPDLVCAEENPWSVRALGENLKAAGRKAAVLRGKAEKQFPAWCEKAKPEKPMALVDPPRTGLALPLADFLSKPGGIKNLAYLSCHLGTLTRDLGNLLKGGWQIEEAVPFDMFPRTKHIEILALLKRGS